MFKGVKIKFNIYNSINVGNKKMFSLQTSGRN